MSLAGILLGCLLGGFSGCNPTVIGNGDPHQYYLLGFRSYPTLNLVARWSADGRQWASSNFPPGSVVGVGVGAVSLDSGAVHIMFWVDSSGNLQIQRGTGTKDFWADDPQGPTLSQLAHSAPSATAAGNNQYLVAFNSGGRASVRVLDHSTDNWLSNDFRPPYGTNNGVLGRPAIAVLNSTVVLAWARLGAVTLAVGNVISQDPANPLSITWGSQSQDFDIAETDYGGPGIPALTHNGNQFLLGVVRRTNPQLLEHDALFIYTSGDGVNWTLLTQTSIIPLYSSVSIAARSDGSILATMVASTNKREVRLFQGGTWTKLDANDVFGAIPTKTDLALITNVVQ